MANDVYVKFGECDDRGGPLNTPLPDIEGDSSDSLHYWWCELRECGFDMETPQQADSEGGDGGGGSSGGSKDQQPASGFKSVRLRKRVDWASPQLFLKCCEAAMATTTKSTEDKGKGKIDQVTVEVCRPASGDQPYTLDDGTSVRLGKIPCAKVEYKGVRILRYEISINGPEPAESVTFEFDQVRYTYLQTDPETGALVDQSGLKTPWLDNHHPDAQTSSNDSAAANDTPGSSNGSTGASNSGNGSPAPAAAVAAAVGAPTSPGAPPDSTVNVNFPGLWQGTGFGLLPD